MGSTVNSFTLSDFGSISSEFRWDSLVGLRMRSYKKIIQLRGNSRRVYGHSAAGENEKIGWCLSNSGKRIITASCFERNKEGNSMPEKLEPLWDDGYGTQTVRDYIEIAKDMIRPDNGPPRWFCPIECGCPMKDSPVLLYLPGLDGLGLGLLLHHKALGKVFEVQCMHIPVNDRTPFEGLVNFVENAVRLENDSSSKKPIYLVAESFGSCIALSVAARNPTIDLVLVLINPGTSYRRSKFQHLLPLLEALPNQLHTIMPYLTSLSLGDPFKMAMVNTDGFFPAQNAEHIFSKLSALLPRFTDLVDSLPMDFYTWKMKILETAAAYANSRLHAVKAEVLVLASGKDNMLPSKDEARRLKKCIQNCQFRFFEDNGHAFLMEDGVGLLTIIKGTCTYRRKSKHDVISDFLPPSLSEFKLNFDKILRFFRLLTSPVMFSTLDDGNIVRGLRGVPDQGPVLLVGYHMFFGVEIESLIEGFLKEKKVMVRGIAHPEMFTENFRLMYDEFSTFDLFRVFGAVPASGRNLFKLFATNSHILLYPGGAREALHRKDEFHKLFWPDQPEFVRMAIKFGVTIVPFGVVGADDVMGVFLDYNDQMKIPNFSEKIRQQNKNIVKLRNRIDLKGEEVSNQDFHLPGFYPKIPGRFYFLFGKPIETKGMEEYLNNDHLTKKFYLQIKSEVQNNIAYLLEKRKQDPYRDLFARTAYRAISMPVHDVPSFDP